ALGSHGTSAALATHHEFAPPEGRAGWKKRSSSQSEPPSRRKRGNRRLRECARLTPEALAAFAETEAHGRTARANSDHERHTGADVEREVAAPLVPDAVAERVAARRDSQRRQAAVAAISEIDPEAP